MFGMNPWKKENRSLTRADEFPISRIRDEFEAIFDRVFGGLPEVFADWSTGSFWGLDVEENDKEVMIRAAAPGFDKEDFDLQVSGNMLTIHAEHKQETQDKNGGHFSERRHGTFHQSFSVPPGTDPDQVEARYRNGILEICLKKKPEAQGRVSRSLTISKSVRSRRRSKPRRTRTHPARSNSSNWSANDDAALPGLPAGATSLCLKTETDYAASEGFAAD